MGGKVAPGAATATAGLAAWAASLGCLCSPNDGFSPADTAAGTLDTALVGCEPSGDPTIDVNDGDRVGDLTVRIERCDVGQRLGRCLHGHAG